jgi:pilus assembly protein FimV
MKTNTFTYFLVLFLVSWGLMTDADALTFGRARGAAVLGQTLDVTIPIQYGVEEDAGIGCFEADVFYGDLRLESSRVSVSVVPASAPQSVNVKVLAAVKIDEPVVTFYLKTTCSQKASRKYVLLADFLSEPVERAGTPEMLSEPRLLPRAQPLLRNEAKTEKPAGTRIEANPVAQKKTPQASPLKSPSAKRSRLTLTPVDGWSARDPVLKSTNEMMSAPVEDLQKRVQALATWRALNASAEDMLRDEARVQSLEVTVKKLDDATLKNRQSLDQLTAQLTEAEAQRYANPFIYGLIAALLASLGLSGYLWNRRLESNSGAAWWGADVAQESFFEPVGVKAKADLTPANSTDAIFLSPEVSSSPGSLSSMGSVDIDLGDASLNPISIEPTAPAALAGPNSSFGRGVDDSILSRRDFGVSIAGALRSMNSREMLDVCQQAEFFMALGRHDEAIAVLESGLLHAGGANPLVYLDLLKLFHTLSKKNDFDRCRDEFNKLFTGLVPGYSSFHRGGNSLDAYPQVCAQIVDLWPTSAAIEYIEHCMVRNSTDADDQGFDMDAFRDLLMLDAIAKQLEAPNVTTIAPFSAPASLYNDGASHYGGDTDRFGTLSDLGDLDVPTQMPSLANPDSVDLDLWDLDGNLIDFDISSYEKSVAVDANPGTLGGINSEANDVPAKHQG